MLVPIETHAPTGISIVNPKTTFKTTPQFRTTQVRIRLLLNNKTRIRTRITAQPEKTLFVRVISKKITTTKNIHAPAPLGPLHSEITNAEPTQTTLTKLPLNSLPYNTKAKENLRSRLHKNTEIK
jgi:hypothetical protein